MFDTSASAKRVVIPAGKGIAGHVFTTGKFLNVTDAYEDPRFNKAIDVQTGYKTKSILCLPVPGPQGHIVGVCTLLNKLDKDGNVTIFSDLDVQIFKTFVALCGLALHKAILLDQIQNHKKTLEINMDIMAYHTLAQPQDLEDFMSHIPSPKFTIDELRDFNYDPHMFSLTDDQLCLIVTAMFKDMGFLEKYKISEKMCTQYTLTIRKNYRKVAYHNFTHATCVAHAIYLLMNRTQLKDVYDDMELFAMFLAALNHDIDHRGTNNQFQKTAQTALANYYSTSVMERHHFNHAVMIMRSPGHNMFHSLSNENYKKCLKFLEQCILATDLALYFGNKGKLKELTDNKSFSWKDETHAHLVSDDLVDDRDVES